MRPVEDINYTPGNDKTTQTFDPQDHENRFLQLASEIKEVILSKRSPVLNRRLPVIQQLIKESVARFRAANEQDLHTSYDAEWLLDNDYLVYQAIRQVEVNLPEEFNRNLPVLVSGIQAGQARIYILGLEIVTAARMDLDLEVIESFVTSFQSITPLTMGELWALPSILRLAILQSLVVSAARLTGIDKPEREIELIKPNEPNSMTDEEVIASGITSLRMLAVQNWKNFFEDLSLVESTLANDPSGIYTRMDFETRDSYRKVVEAIAGRSGEDEVRVANAAVQLALDANRMYDDGHDTYPPHYPGSIREGHVGHYLIGDGRFQLESAVGYTPDVRKRLERWLSDRPTLVYLGSIILMSILPILGFILTGIGANIPAGMILIGSLLVMTPAVAFAVAAVNWLIMHYLPPKVLPKMDYSKGIVEGIEAIVAVPALIDSLEGIDSLTSQLELHYLRNPDPNLTFVLVTDFTDAPFEHLPGDGDLLQHMREKFTSLNQRHPREKGSIFLYFHRPRTWNPGEGVWMGWERKRGKLHQLNQLILEGRGKRSTAQEDREPSIHANLDLIGRACCVITLDEDTILPPESAQRLVAAITHPLNRAEFDGSGRVTSGYTILQPRTRVSPIAAMRTPFTRIFSGETGLDLYTLAVSDVYQDLFGEGIYTGKGVYDVEAFERSLEGQVPENALLSHDLFEGLLGRTALVSDIVLIEDYPSAYLGHVRRMQRWIRGDWQLLPWLMGQHRSVKGTKIRLDLIDRWKIFDNLRRSLVGPALLVLLAAAWLGILPGPAGMWTAASLLGLGAPFLTGLLEKGWHSRAGLLRYIGENLPRLVMAVIFLPFESLIAIDAILRTLWRLMVSHKNLLTWQSSADVEKLIRKDTDRLPLYRSMVGEIIIAVLLTGWIITVNPQEIWLAAPFLLAWIASPEIAHIISQLPKTRRKSLTEKDITKLRWLARSTSLFFEKFVGPEDHWLPPDHFQEEPLGTAAHRTSPTNIGMSLLASLTAYDFGYTGLLALAARLRSSFDTLGQLERYRGHFLNWYDTRSLEPLQPSYVSTVDSGNLAASLIVLRQGMLDLPDKKILRWEIFQGIVDTLSLISVALENHENKDIKENTLRLRTHIESWRSLLLEKREIGPQRKEINWVSLLEMLQAGDHRGAGLSDTLDQLLLDLVESCGPELGQIALGQLRVYSTALRTGIEMAVREIDILIPWARCVKEIMPYTQGEDEKSQLWRGLVGQLSESPTLVGYDLFGREAQRQITLLKELIADCDGSQATEEMTLLQSIDRQIESGLMAAKVLQIGFQDLGTDAEKLSREMDFGFLYDNDRQVFHIGYNISLNRLDPNYYDMLASEARIASLIAISRSEVPISHWLHLARPVADVGGLPVLLSWSATMFEYLMPALFNRRFSETLLETSLEGAIDTQIEYARGKGVPWGISESGYYRFDLSMAYQYKAFGVPALGYKRGLGEDMVIAPYASLLGLPFRPEAVMANLETLEKLGGSGLYGMYEAIDFTPERMPLGKRFALVREYMAHHQGMIFLSIANVLMDEIVIRRFHTDQHIQSVELLLQEKVPEKPVTESLRAEQDNHTGYKQPQVIITPWRARVNATHPRVHYLSNGRLGTLITAVGGGYSTWNGIDLTRWRSDTTLGDWGTWIYIQDLDNHRTWSAGLMPTGVNPDSRDVYFNAHMASFLRRDGDIGTSMEISISPDDDVEIRMLTLTNQSERTCRLRVVSYGEVILASQTADRRHPAFNKLFIESEYIPNANVLLFKRRPRSVDEESFYLGHALITQSDLHADGLFESDRMRFLGRLRNTRSPLRLEGETWGTGSQGATLDPIFSLGQVIELKPHSSTRLAFLTMIAQARTEALNLVSRYKTWTSIERAFGRARAQAEMEFRQQGLDTIKLPRIQHLLSGLLFPHRYLRASDQTISANQKGQSGLWPYGISGDFPILLVKIGNTEEIALAQELFQAHNYWRSRGVMIDLVVLNEQGADYGQELTNGLMRILQRSGSDAWLNRRGGIFLLWADRLNPGDLELLETTARVMLDGKRGSLAENLSRIDPLPSRLPAFTPTLSSGIESEPTRPLIRPDGLLFDNGIGGFSPDGKEYVIYLESGTVTPHPWVNVVGYPEFGFITHESGLGSTWAANSGENRLTPWRNDPVSDRPAEAVYLRDEETGFVWSPTLLPSGDDLPYLVRHGAGYTIYEHNSQGLIQSLKVLASPEDPIKIISLRLENTWNHTRRITATYYAEWVLGLFHEDTQMFIVPEFDSETQALLVRNSYHPEYSGRIAFAAASQKLHGLTSDRTEFLGRLGSYDQPGALRRIGLAGKVRPADDPCAALQLHLDLQPGETQEIYFLLGQGADREDALGLVRKYQDQKQIESTWKSVGDFWDRNLGAVQVRTPDLGMDLLLNRWLMYQALSCRFWGRSAFYQPSGAYGYRDQLQDTLAFLHTRPDLTREHILLAAAHQFEKGDVLHWWHPPDGRGIRSRFSDDMLWLPSVTAQYVQGTGDYEILDVQVPYVTGSQLESEEKERYGQYLSTAHTSSIYDHCRKAIDAGSTKGRNGLPLIGIGDWNDGMNRIGEGGLGESVWLAWFLIDVLQRFAEICEARGDLDQAENFRSRAEGYRKSVGEHAWDGQWYLRAFYDDGTPLGSARNRECKIDSIAQSWAVLSGVGEPERAKTAMAAVREHLVRIEDGLVLLFAPPFDTTPRDPGYIKGYIPGIRENGGQYTHAAIWTAWAFASLGESEYANTLFDQLNPIRHALDPKSVQRYRVEPYVIAADIYGASPFTGRGGWTWYTGSAAWMYRLGLEALLGLRKVGDTLEINPCVREEWNRYEIDYKYGKAVYKIFVERSVDPNRSQGTVIADGELQESGRINLVDDGNEHLVTIAL